MFPGPPRDKGARTIRTPVETVKARPEPRRFFVYRPPQGLDNTDVSWTMDGDPVHPILDRPHEYSIAELRYHAGLDGTEPYVDLEFRKEAVVRRLRFWSPQQFAIEEGCFPHPTHGMEILDVRGRRLEGLGVRVADFEGSPGAITFWARQVVDLDTLEAS